MAYFDGKYDTTNFYYGTQANDFLVEKSLALKAHSIILSLGEGEGRNAVYLAQKGHKVLGIDESSVGLAKALKLAELNNVKIETRVCNIADFHFAPKTYDAIISIWCHLPPALRTEVHQKCVASLKPNGIFILEAYTVEQLNYNTGGPKDKQLFMSLVDLKSELKGLKIINETETIRMVKEGSGHDGLSAVVQIMAMKLT